MAQDLVDTTFIVTGATSGIGKITARELAVRGGRVVITGRSVAKAEPVVAELRAAAGHDRIEAVALDLGNLESVRACAAELLRKLPAIHVLVNNAGLAGARGVTSDGFELVFGTNHIGPYLLTRLLLDRIVASGVTRPARIVNVASKSHYQAKGIDWDAIRKPTRTITALHEYAVSKLANVVFAKELARRLDAAKVTTYALHPGVVATEVWRKVPWPVRPFIKRFMLTPEQGAVASVACAASPELAQATGRYYDYDGKEREPNPVADDVALGRTLWEKSAALTGLAA